MIIQVSTSGKTDEFAEMLNTAAQNDQIKSILILACDDNQFTPSGINSCLCRIQKPIFGGIFPEILVDHQKLAKGFIIAGLTTEARVQVIGGLSNPNIDYESEIQDSLSQTGAKTMLVLVDGLATRITSLVDSLFTVFGLDFNYIGGGAGSLSFQQKPCLFTNEGLIQDSAVLVSVPIESGVGVSHGWMDVAGPFKVTESDRNQIITLDWKPALEVYRDVVEAHSGLYFTESNFFDIAKSYPFGINKLGAEKIVRDPVKVGPKDSLICVGEVPQESYIHILTGNVDSLVHAAQTALLRSEKSFRGQDGPKTALFIDCISRVLFLEDMFMQELDAVHCSTLPLIGALTIGEIANSGSDYLEFYNKTSVVAMLEN